MQTILWISLGAIVGANLRYFIAYHTAKLTTFPYGTLIVNVTGSFLIGFFLMWSTERVIVDPRWRLLVVVGFCGGYTTFSSYAFETVALFEQGRWLASAMNVLLSNTLCFLGVLAGATLARST